MENGPNAFCSACGGALSPDDAYCGTCGVAVANAPRGAVTLGSATSLAPEQAVDTAAVAPPPPAMPAAPTLELPFAYGSFLQRVAASLVDLGIVFAAFMAVSFGIGIVGYAILPERDVDQFIDTTSDGAYTVAFLVLWVLYRPVLWHFRDGQSFGQALAKVRVRTETGERMSPLNGLGRQLATGLLYLFFWPILMAIDVLWMTWDKTGRHQTLHDKIAKTIVVSAGNKEAR